MSVWIVLTVVWLLGVLVTAFTIFDTPRPVSAGFFNAEDWSRAALWPVTVPLHLRRRRQAERREDVATLERAESVLTALDDAPPPLPPAIPVSMRDPAFRARIEALEQANGSETHYLSRKHGGHGLITGRELKAKLLAQPLIAERRFTLLTHCPQGHVATHWLGATTDDHIERICRFEQCAATWLEKR